MSKREGHLGQLIKKIPGVLEYPVSDALISGIKIDSREVNPGDVFVALEGQTTDGHLFIQDAIRDGAVAVIGKKSIEGLPLPYVQVQDDRLALAYLSAAYFGFPARQLVMIGVTGTDGKTTTANLIYNILKEANIKTGMITTVNALIGSENIDTGFHVTTPEAPHIQNYLDKMVQAEITHVVIEATSHGLDQHRVTACEFDIGVLTNITHEHLDYHGSYENYRRAKGRLFSSLGHSTHKTFLSQRGAVLNLDDDSYKFVSSITSVPIITYSRHAETGADVFAEDVNFGRTGLSFQSLVPTSTRDDSGADRRKFCITSDLIGEYNVSNCLAAVAVTSSLLGIDDQVISSGIERMEPIPGRMETIDLGQSFPVIVDFAHTPNALLNTLQSFQDYGKRGAEAGRIISVLGSAGLRDIGKRRMMAEISFKYADITILTAEDPRTESLDKIISEMASGIINLGGVEGGDFWRIPDRRDAIRLAVEMALPGDVVLILGKGHEQSMCFGDTEYSWDDRTAVRSALAGHLGISGPEMPYLPSLNNDSLS